MNDDDRKRLRRIEIAVMLIVGSIIGKMLAQFAMWWLGGAA